MRQHEILALLSGAGVSSAARTETKLDDAAALTAEFLYFALKVPALVIGVVEDGQTSIHGFGAREDGASAEPDGNTLFRIGSITKVFAGQVLASLAADGVVSLADPLTRYVPEFASPLSGGARPIRLVDLATHSAGLPREVPHAPGPAADPFANTTREAFATWLKANPLRFHPGTSILYSNFGFDLLATALSAAAGKPYPELISERVLKPLGLVDTTFAPEGDQTARLLRGHDPDGAAVPYVPTGEVMLGSSGLYSTARDLLRWLNWHLDRFSDQRAAERLIDHAAWLWRDGLDSVFGMDEAGRMDAMGLGWVIMQPEGDRPLILQKSGGLQGVFSYAAFAPARNIGVIAAISVLNLGGFAAMAQAANALLAQLAPR
jgi:serine-type D-Ala-D-Ala carboxypeptidase/endopeptidase